MQSQEQITNHLDNRYKAAATVIFIGFFSAVALTLAAFFLAGKIQPFGETTGEASFSIENLIDPSAAHSTFTTFLWITILAVAISVFLLRRVIFAPAVLRDIATVKGATGLLQSLSAKTMLLAAFGELVAVLGFLIALASGNWLDMLRAALIATIIFFINFPRKSVWRRLAQIVK